MNKKEIIICRCEDISLEALYSLFEEGYSSFEEIKRLLRVGMGPCQGITCSTLIQKEISRYFKIPIEKVKTHVQRPLVMGVKLQAIVEGIENES